MNCFYCKGDMILGYTTYAGTTLQKVEQILEKCKAAMTEVAIVEYQPAA